MIFTRTFLKHITAFILLVSFVQHSAFAIEEDYFAESDFFGESPVVLTVSRLHKPLAESPASVSVIDRQMIRDSGASQVADIFRLVPGFYVSHNARNANAPLVYYHGLGEEFYRQFQVLIDGRSVFIPSFGGVPWHNLPLSLEDIERVEVTRGPNAVTYGANAFLATINIITRNAAEDSGIFVSSLTDVNSSSESNDLYFRFGNQISDFDWRVTAQRQEDDGIDSQHDASISNKINIRTDFLTDHNQFWTIQAGINDSTFNMGDGAVNDIFRDKKSTNSYQNIKWELIEDKVNSTIAFSHTRQNVDDKFETPVLNTFFAPALSLIFGTTPVPDFTGTVNFDRVSDRVDLEAFQTRKLNAKTTINYGLSYRQDKVRSSYLFSNIINNERKVDTHRVYTGIEWKSNFDMILDFGVVAEDTSLTEKEVSGRFTAIQKLANHHLRLVYSTAKRKPVLWELIGNSQFDISVPGGVTLLLPIWEGNNNLLPESIKSTEIGLFSNFYHKQITTDLKLFTYSISDQITTEAIPATPATPPAFVLSPTLRTPSNDINTDVEGTEISVNFSPRSKNFRIYGGLSSVHKKSTNSRVLSAFPDKISFIGGHINLGMQHQISGLLNKTYRTRLLDVQGFADTYTKIDLRYQYTIDAKSSTTLELIGRNLHQDYDDFGLNLEQEKSYFLRISTRL